MSHAEAQSSPSRNKANSKRLWYMLAETNVACVCLWMYLFLTFERKPNVFLSAVSAPQRDNSL
jgi:hypothetical protein